MSKWTKIDDQPPEEGVRVLVHHEHFVESLSVIVAMLRHGRWYVQENWQSDTLIESEDVPDLWAPIPEIDA